MPQTKDDRSLGDLFRDLSREMVTLVRHEVDYAKTEMSQKVSRAGKDIAFLAFGGVVAYAGFLCILVAFIVLLAEIMPLWVAALLVGVVVGTIGSIFLGVGILRLQRKNLAPTEAAGILKEEGKWLKSQVT